MNNLQVFNFNNYEIRSCLINEKPMFVAKDVAKALKYSNTKDAVKRHCLGVAFHDSLNYRGNPLAIIPESDVYRLIIRSKLPSAVKFEKWVMEDVLPSIRKTGGYLSPNVDFTDPTNLKRILDNWEKDKQKLIEQEPKVNYFNDVLKSKEALPITIIAKAFGFRSATQLNKILREKKVQHKVNKQWVLNAPFTGLGYTIDETIAVDGKDDCKKIIHTTRWTEKGKAFLYNFLKEHGYLDKGCYVPVIEKEVTCQL